MNKDGKIIVIEDDPDDQDMFKYILSSLEVTNEIVMFKNGLDAYTYLADTHDTPFIIFSDINMPVMNGFELRKKMQAYSKLNMLTVPFIFITTGDTESAPLKNFLPYTQGIYSKPKTLPEFKSLIKEIIELWKDKSDDPIA